MRAFKAVLFCFLFLPALFFAQGADKNNSVLIKHSPKKAVLLSLLPGAGQIYNHKYWKVPFIYAAFAGFAYFAVVNNKAMSLYKSEYIYRRDHSGHAKDSTLVNYSTDNILTLKEDYQKFLYIDYIGFAAVYLLNLIDATVDAHMYTFDVSDDLSMRVQPTFIYTSQNSHPITGIGLSFKF